MDNISPVAVPTHYYYTEIHLKLYFLIPYTYTLHNHHLVWSKQLVESRTVTYDDIKMKYLPIHLHYRIAFAIHKKLTLYLISIKLIPVKNFKRIDLSNIFREYTSKITQEYVLVSCASKSPKHMKTNNGVYW